MGGLNIPRKLHNHRRVVLVRAASSENNQATSVYLTKEENRTVSSSSSTTFAEIYISVISFCIFAMIKRVLQDHLRQKRCLMKDLGLDSDIRGKKKCRPQKECI